MHFYDEFEEKFEIHQKTKKNKVKKFKKDVDYIEIKKDKAKKDASRKKERESKNFEL